MIDKDITQQEVNDLMDGFIGENEAMYSIQVPESTATYDGYKLQASVNYLVRCKCFGPTRAVNLVYYFIVNRLYAQFNLTGADRKIENLPIVPANFSSNCDDEGFGWLWGVTFDIIPFSQLINDPDSEYYYTCTASGQAKESYFDAIGVPLYLQYRYPLDHPEFPNHVISSIKTIIKDDAIFTFRLNLVKEMKYPEAAGGFISHVNQLAWKGFPPRSVKITNIMIRGMYTDPERTDLDKHTWIITFEFQVKDSGWDASIAIIDPLTGEVPGDIDFSGAIQDPSDPRLLYPPARQFVPVLPEFDFHRIFPDDDDTTFQERGEYEFPIGS